MPTNRAGEWCGPGMRRPRSRFTWNALLWSMVYPQRGHRTLPTVPGLVLIALSFGIGMAAYNSSNNILFITLSLLLACLILSGVLSWLNLRGIRWRLHLAPPLRAGHDTVIGVDLHNGKRFLPTYGLWFEFAARPVEEPGRQRAESTVTARSAEVRDALAKAEAEESRGRVPLAGRLDARTDTRIEWVLKPGQRGRWRLEVASVGSLFPFGFLRKDLGTDMIAETIVWPAPVEYRRHAAGVARRASGGERVPRAGSGSDLLALRRYQPGDSHRLIHWKASARTRTLLVRQFGAESAEGYSLWLRTDASVWTRPEQFELLIGFVATLAEDLFRAERLRGVAIDAEPLVPVRRVRDLELLLDRLAVVTPRAAEGMQAAPAGGSDSEGAWRQTQQHVMIFAPDGARGVAAYLDGQKAASA